MAAKDPLEIARQIVAEGYTVETMAVAMAQMGEEIGRLKQELRTPEDLVLPRGRKVARPSSPSAARERLRFAVRYFYDLQRLRIQTGARAPQENRATEMELDAEDSEWMEQTSANLASLEKQALREISGLLHSFPIAEWLLSQKGLGPTMCGVIVCEFKIETHDTVSKMWAFAGLNVRDGKAPRPVRGQRLPYNSWLRMKLVGVMAPNFLKAGSAYRDFYDNYKLRCESKRQTCVACGRVPAKMRECRNCEGSGIGPWGVSKGHRHNASLRYMVKQFLGDLYHEWRTLEGLPTRVRYDEEYLGNQRHTS